jgi:glycerol-3-phosphate dehydrogenase subunit C
MAQQNKKQIVYYPGCTVMFWNPEIGKAAVRVFERNGYEVLVPKHNCCEVAKTSYGNFSSALPGASKLNNELYKFVKQGLEIVVSCPSCFTAIHEDHPMLLKSEQAKEVAEKTIFFSVYLNRLNEQKLLNTNLKPNNVTIAYHAPCHLRAHNLGDASVKLLRLIPGTKVIDIDRGCCGMSGTAGFKHRHYAESMKIGQAVFDRVKELNADLLSTDCAGCAMQLEHGIDHGLEVVHPLIILDRAYA